MIFGCLFNIFPWVYLVRLKHTILATYLGYLDHPRYSALHIVTKSDCHAREMLVWWYFCCRLATASNALLFLFFYLFFSTYHYIAVKKLLTKLSYWLTWIFVHIQFLLLKYRQIDWYALLRIIHVMGQLNGYRRITTDLICSIHLQLKNIGTK